MPGTVLVVDDEQRYCRLLQRVLENEGFVVTTADCPLAARDLLEGGGFDLLITDLDMPGLSGLELAESAGRLARPPRMLLITAQKSLLMKNRGRPHNLPCLLKPFSLADLRTTVAQLIGAWPLPDPGAPSSPEPFRGPA